MYCGNQKCRKELDIRKDSIVVLEEFDMVICPECYPKYKQEKNRE
jgi:hypothetical protein